MAAVREVRMKHKAERPDTAETTAVSPHAESLLQRFRARFGKQRTVRKNKSQSRTGAAAGRAKPVTATGKMKRVFRRSGVRRGIFFAIAVAAVYLSVLHGATPEK